MDGELDSFIYGYLKWMCNKWEKEE
jgi:hypothetical protein